MSSEIVKTGAPAISNMDDLNRIADMLSKSGYFDDAKGAAQCGVKVLAGMEMGIPAFSAMAGIHIVKGKPTVGANLMAAKLKASDKYDYRVKQLDDNGCTIAFYQGGEEIGVSTFTKQDAAKAGTQNMQKFGRNMMFARAMSNGVKWFTPDIFLAPVYTPEELGVPVDGEGNVLQAEIIEPEKPPKPPQSEARTDTPRLPAKAANTPNGEASKPLGAKRGAAMRGHLVKLGFDDREIDILVMFNITERNVETLADLTDAEAKLVLKDAEEKAKQRKAAKDEPPFEPDPEPEDFAPDGPGSRLLSNAEAANLHRALGAFGVKDHYAFASEVMGRKVVSLQASTVATSVKIYEAALKEYGSASQQAEHDARKAAA